MRESGKEQIIQELVVEGNDEQVVRMIDALWSLEPEQIEERINIQIRLGRRYMILAMSQENGIPDEDVEALLERWFVQGIPLQSASDRQRNRKVLGWYMEANKLFSAALERALLLPPLSKVGEITHQNAG